MGSDANAGDDQAGAPADGSPDTNHLESSPGWDEIGYEAADPSAHAPWWDEARRIDAATRSRR